MDNFIADIADLSAVKAEIVSIELDRPLDWITDVPVDNSKLIFLNKDGDEVNGRLEIYNEYGDTKNDPGVNLSAVDFNGRMSINFSVSGIDGNLKPDADGAYTSDISYAAFDWYPSYWGGCRGTSNVTGDGTYNVYVDLDAPGKGAVVWCVELYNIWKDLIDLEQVKIEIHSITTEI